MVLCIIFYIGTNNYEKFGGFYDFLFNLERLHLGWRDGVCFVFKQISAVFIEICIIYPGMLHHFNFITVYISIVSIRLSQDAC